MQDDNDYEEPSESGEQLPEVVTVDRPHRLPRPGRAEPMPQPRPSRLPAGDSEAASIHALTEAMGTMFLRVDQQGKTLQTMYEQLQAVLTEMRDTMTLLQEGYSQIDTMIDKLARIMAASVKLYQIEAEADQDSLF